MPGQASSTIDVDKYLLVSDSNEVVEQLDSRKLTQGDLSDMAFNELFKRHFDMSRYLTKNQYNTYMGMLDQNYDTLNAAWEDINTTSAGKFRVVNGQVILLKKSELPKDKSPIDYIKEHWYIPVGCTLLPIRGCMLRGVSSQARTGIQLPANITVELDENNIPSHKHHSGVTRNSGVDTISIHSSTTDKSVPDSQQAVYGVFNDDSFATGLDNNMSNEFTIQDAGNSKITHDNMPVYDEFYAFAVQMNVG